MNIKNNAALISDEQMVKILFYVDVACAVLLPLLGWYFHNVWLAISGLISIIFAVFKPMRHIRPWMEKHLTKLITNRKA